MEKDAEYRRILNLYGLPTAFLSKQDIIDLIDELMHAKDGGI